MSQQNLTPALLEAAKTTFIASFNKGLKESIEIWPKIAGYVKSNGVGSTYAFLSQIPAFKEWFKGNPRVHKKMAETAFLVKNRKFENTFDIAAEEFEDDQWGQYATIAYAHGQSVIDLKNDIIFELFNRGFTETCYDGQYFFDTDHPVYANEDGTGTFKTVSNMQAGTGEPWVLLCTKRAPKPFYLQERMAAEFTARNATNSDRSFDYDLYSWGGKWRGEAVLGFYQCAYASKAPLTPENFSKAVDAMMMMQADGGKPLNIVPYMLVCGVSNRAAAEQILKSKLVDGTDNVNYGRTDLLVTPLIKA